MFPYWVLFSVVALGAVIDKTGINWRRAPLDPLLVIIMGLIALMIGLRFNVGGDWWTYTRYYQFALLATFEQIIAQPDPGYMALNFVAAQLGAGLWLVNLFCGAVFSWGLYRIAKSQPFPWLSLLVAVPYMIVVLAMGYSRQGIAIGIMMAGIASYQRRGSIIRYALYVLVAALFHRTAVIGLPLLLLGGQRGWLVNVLVGLSGSVLLYDVFLAGSMDQFIKSYVGTEMSSQGAFIRVAMNLLPAAFFLIFHKQMGFTPLETAIWRNFSYAALGLAVALALVASSTVVDRLALYILPLQIAVLPRIAGPLINEWGGKLAIIFYCFAIQFVWLNYATHANYWLPYRVYPLDSAA